MEHPKRKVKTKVKISWEQKEFLRWNKKHFSSLLKGYHWSKYKKNFGRWEPDFKVFYSTLIRTNASILVILNSSEMWWRNFSIYNTMMKITKERLSNAWIHCYVRNRCKNKVNAGRWMVCKIARFVNNLSIPRGRYIDIKFLSNLVTSSKRTTLSTFSLRSPTIIEIAGLRLPMLFTRTSKESQKD